MESHELIFSNNPFFTEISDMLSCGTIVTIRAKGNSMFPFIRDGRDSVMLRRSDQLEVGDIVLAEIPGRGYVLHRIYNMNGEELTLMGDGNRCGMEHCSRADIRGKSIKILRNGREIDCSSFTERLKATCWRKLLPLRRYLLFMITLLGGQHPKVH